MKRAAFLTILILLLASTARAADECEITATGDLSFTAKGSGNMGSVGTDYWLTDDEMKMALGALVGIAGGSKLSDAEKAQKLDEAMKKDPRFMLLLLNCKTDDATLTIGPAKDTKYKDVPMKPGSYKFAPTMKAKPGDMTVLSNIKVDKGLWAAQDGKLDITAWDKKHIAGAFEIQIAKRDFGGGPGKKATLKGSFDFPCRAGKVCEK